VTVVSLGYQEKGVYPGKMEDPVEMAWTVYPEHPVNQE